MNATTGRIKKTLGSAFLIVALAGGLPAFAQIKQSKMPFEDKFRQLEGETLPTPNIYRTAAGEPGFAYWQQRADYDIDIALDEENRRISASETIRYYNRSPDTLRFLWVQLDQNRFRKNSIFEMGRDFGGTGGRNAASRAPKSGNDNASMPIRSLRRQQMMEEDPYGFEITGVRAADGATLSYVIVGTMMRIDLPVPLRPAGNFSFRIDWAFNIIETKVISGRGGYEHFSEDGNDVFTIAQWYPRMVAYSDYEAWHNKQFIGRGEFTLEFGDYDVRLRVPADHIVSATGTLQNATDVLTNTQRERLAQARQAKKPVFIVTPEEARENEKNTATTTKTWHFRARNVRDFAWASSRKFIWDAQGHPQPDAQQPLVMAMSFYPNEAEPLWSHYSTESILQTLKTYSRFTFDYPYPSAQSVNSPVFGMEYPMISFNGPRPEKDDDGNITYSRSTKRALISVIIHEIGHNYFPMIVNSDERQWTWMDEGMNSFLQTVAENEWDIDYPSRRGTAETIIPYMRSMNQVPIMTNSESIMQFGNNAYGKPAAAFTILRETIMGRELFDFAFKEFARRWQFKRPTPADFFRTMEEASGVDLDWFWRGWFYSTDHVDIALKRVWALELNSGDPVIEKEKAREKFNARPVTKTDLLDKAEQLQTRVRLQPDLRDFYDENDPFTVSPKDRKDFEKKLDELEDEEKAALERGLRENKRYYVFEFDNLGGLVMPIILRLHYADKSSEDLFIPVEIWSRNNQRVHKLLVRDRNKRLVKAEVDPHRETADVNTDNNIYPPQIMPSQIELFEVNHEAKSFPRRDLMLDMIVKEDDEEED